MVEGNYKCPHCGHRFVQEQRFLRHRCDQMKRQEVFQQPLGQAAWIFYQKWMRAYNKAVANANSFLHSKFFNSFIKFADFVKTVKMADTDVFIALMKEYDISPTIWTNDQVYALYLEQMDKKLTPEKHAEITVNTLFDLAEDYDVDVSDVFQNVPPAEIIQLLRARKLSPWILLNSRKFGAFYKQRTSTEERIVIDSIIRPPYWKKKFDSNPEKVEAMRKYVSELTL